MKIIIFMIISYFIMTPIYGSEHQRLTYEQAEALALIGATVRGMPHPIATVTRKESGFSNEKINSMRFISFQLIYPSSNGFAYYTVDFYTGDVFMRPNRDACAYPNELLDEIKTKKLSAIQKEVHRNLHLTRSAYKRFRLRKPKCRDL